MKQKFEKKFYIFSKNLTFQITSRATSTPWLGPHSLALLVHLGGPIASNTGPIPATSATVGTANVGTSHTTALPSHARGVIQQLLTVVLLL